MILNKEQEEAVYTSKQFLFLLAGAGTGKTRVIVERVKYLLKNSMCKEEDILAITFTKKAAREMKERLDDIDVSIKTFHKFCYDSLDIKQEKILENIPDEFKDEKLNITKYKNSFKKIKKPNKYEIYQKYLHDNQKIDLDDLQIDMYYLLKNKAQDFNYKYIFIDEFQDTNDIQYEILKLLIKDKTSVFCVGDPDQSIYRFRGANNNIIDKFIKEYDSTTLFLINNYRSTKEIVDKANTLIKNNKIRIKKDMITNSLKEGNISCQKFENKEQETLYIMEYINVMHIKYKIDYDEMAVIARNNINLYEITLKLISSYIPIKNDSQKGISLLTIHKSKGLEFELVVILGLEKSNFPSLKDNRISELEEERRLMFVAVTRTKQYLLLTYTQKTHIDNRSIFIKELRINLDK